MRSFLEETVLEVWGNYGSLENIVFVLPSKRAGTFLKDAISRHTNRTILAPKIHSIESFISGISGLSYAPDTVQLLELYKVYSSEGEGQKDDFFTFSKWAGTLLQDFNEIDRYLIDPKSLFANLSAIQEVNHWSVRSQKTPLMHDYLRFWNGLFTLYTAFTAALTEQGMGYQGFVYRHACEQLDAYLETSGHQPHIFIGFNALNKAESQIIQRMLDAGNADVYWDIDSSFIEDPVHDAGYFIRKHQRSWPYFKKKPMKGLGAYFQKQKEIEIIGVPKNVSQTKYVGHLLGRLRTESPEDLRKTAVVLGDEGLLNPLLNAIPKTIDRINITMGFPLSKSPMASFFEQLMTLYIHTDSRGWYYQHFVSLLVHPLVQNLLHIDGVDYAQLITKEIKDRNWSYIKAGNLAALTSRPLPILDVLFFVDSVGPMGFISKCNALIHGLREQFVESDDRLQLEFLYRFHSLFNQVKAYIGNHPFIKDIRTLRGLYRQLIASETIDFQGEPLEGLQIMGMLESRNLDFETVIITSVNEDILPSGKSNNSFIPYDLKKYAGLPTYKDKDAVYTYHFYRLLQRAKRVYLLYNTEPGIFVGSEKSRLLMQLLTERKENITIRETMASPLVRPVSQREAIVEKDGNLMLKIRELANKGFSPSSLSNYIRNPIDFYKSSILKIEEAVEVEETVASHTFGTIIHDSLEDLYTDLIGQPLTVGSLQRVKSLVEQKVRYHFIENYSDSASFQGKNLIAFHVAVRYIENFIDLEIEEVKQHTIIILALEKNLHVEMELPEVDFPVTLKGKLDRIDEKDGELRIIDYKTGRVEPREVALVEWEPLTSDYSYAKAFQLLCYAWMYTAGNPQGPLQAGIISFKKLKEGFMPFATKESVRAAQKNTLIDADKLRVFHTHLSRLISEICNPEIPFMEKEVEG